MIKKLNVTKAIQAAGVLLRREGKRAGRLRLLKLLYIADRKLLATTGSQLLGSRIVAMKHGPLHSEVLNLINGEHIAGPFWSKHFTNAGRDVILAQEPDIGELSRHEIELLNSIVDTHLHQDDYEVADETHAFDEWIKNYPDPKADTSSEIPLTDLIAAVGRANDQEAILQDQKDSEAFNRFFSGVAK